MAVPQQRSKPAAPRGRQAAPTRTRSRRPPVLALVGGLIAIVAALAVVFWPQPRAVVTGGPVEVMPTRNHMPDGALVEYSTNPPTSGDHWAAASQWGVYNQAPPDQRLVHNLEHGGVIISYDPGALDQATIDRIKDVTRSLNRTQACAISTPRDNLPEGQPIALTAWGVLVTLDRFDAQAIREFYNEHRANGPEFPQGTCG
jgi:hypothetical protein